MLISSWLKKYIFWTLLWLTPRWPHFFTFMKIKFKLFVFSIEVVLVKLFASWVWTYILYYRHRQWCLGSVISDCLFQGSTFSQHVSSAKYLQTSEEKWGWIWQFIGSQEKLLFLFIILVRLVQSSPRVCYCPGHRVWLRGCLLFLKYRQTLLHCLEFC